MAHSYILPSEVISPKRQWTLVSVLHDRGEGNAAVALGRWEGDPVLAMRWNGTSGNPIGNPQSRGLPTWFIVPNEFRDGILTKIRELAPEKEIRAREFFVDAVVLTNTIAMPDSRKSIQDAVLQGIGSRLDTQAWTVSIFEPQAGPEYVIKIKGPNDFNWERTFFGPGEQTPEFIRNEVHRATH